ncbi:MAG: hypothetical protein AAB731_05050 [Patescibacteria group bacterium]
MARIGREERLLALKGIILFSFGIIFPLAAFFPVLRALMADISVSGLIHYISLVFSDTGVVMASGGDYLLLIVESLPVLGITELLIIMFIFLGSLRLTSRGLSKFYPARRQFLNN